MSKHKRIIWILKSEQRTGNIIHTQDNVAQDKSSDLIPRYVYREPVEKHKSNKYTTYWSTSLASYD